MSIQILDIIRRTPVVGGKEEMKIAYTDAIGGTEIFVEVVDINADTHDGYIVEHDAIGHFVYCREIPYMQGDLSITLLQGANRSNTVVHTAVADQNPGTPVPTTVRISTPKNPLPIVHSIETKGGHHTFDTPYDFLWMPQYRMDSTMTASVKWPDGIVRTYALNWIDVDIDQIPYPLKDKDAGEVDSFRTYWHLLSESKIENPYIDQIEYAPDYNGGIPPYYERPQADGTFDRYVFPVGAEWDDERNFTSNSWAAVQTPDHNWKRVKEGDGQWSIPIAIRANLADLIQENRFIRMFEKPQQEDSNTISIYSYYKGDPNKFAYFDQHSSIYLFSDRQPARRVWDDVTQPEKDAYEVQYGVVLDPNDETLLSRINRLWMTTAAKDIYGGLRSGWDNPIEIIDGDGNLVRYSQDGKGDINKIRADIIASGETDPVVIDNLYTASGWVDAYQYGLHDFMAYRSDTNSIWVIKKTANELGQFTKDYYKPYPINYYDRINNIRTKGDYIPEGINAINNTEDDITEYNWTDAPPEDVPAGFEIYRATTVLNFDMTKLLGSWTLFLVSGRTPLADWITAEHGYFKATVEDIATDDQASTPVYEYDTIQLDANITRVGAEISGLVTEEILYEWVRIYNAGAPDSTVIFNNFARAWDGTKYVYDDALLVDGTVGHEIPTNFAIANGGKSIIVSKEGVDSNAIFELTQWRRVSDDADFEETQSEWVPYKSEANIGDVIDRAVTSVVVSAEVQQFFIDGDSPIGALAKSNFVGQTSINVKAFGTNVDYTGTDCGWYKWDHTAGDFENLKEVSTPAEWKVIERDIATYWIALVDTNMNHNVLWDADDFSDNSGAKPNYNVYRFLGKSQLAEVVIDYVTIQRVKEGTNARDIKISPETFAVPLNVAGDAYDGVSRKKFTVVSQNIPNPVFAWSLKDKNGNEVATKSGSTFFVFDGRGTASIGDEDYKPADLAALTAEAPYTISVTENSTGIDLVEEGIIALLSGGNLGIQGADGASGISVIYDPNDLVPTTADGIPLNSVDESTLVDVYHGNDLQPNGDYIVELVTIPAGVTVAIETSSTIRVTAIPSNTNNKETITFWIKNSSGAYLEDSLSVKALFNYSLVRSFAGATASLFTLSNEAQVINVDDNSKVVTHSLNCGANPPVANSLAKSNVRLLKGIVDQNINSNDCNFTVNGYSGTVVADVATYKEYRFSDVSVNLYIRAYKNDPGYLVRYTSEDPDSLPTLMDIDVEEQVTTETAYKTMTLNTVITPTKPRSIQITPRTTAMFTTDGANELIFDIEFLQGADIVTPWTTPIIKIGGSTGVVISARYVDTGVLRYVTVNKADISTRGIGSALYVESGAGTVGGKAIGTLEVIYPEAAEGVVMVYCRDLTLGGGATSSDNYYATVGAPYGGTISFAAVKNGSEAASWVSNSRTWYKASTNAIWACFRNTNDAWWSSPFKLKGEQGIKGDNGLTGLKGDTGSIGPIGPTGNTGDKGADGNTPYISGGYWYINGNNTGVLAFGIKGDTGDKGDKGDTGDTGADAVLSNYIKAYSAYHSATQLSTSFANFIVLDFGTIESRQCLFDLSTYVYNHDHSNLEIRLYYSSNNSTWYTIQTINCGETITNLPTTRVARFADYSSRTSRYFRIGFRVTTSASLRLTGGYATTFSAQVMI